MKKRILSLFFVILVLQTIFFANYTHSIEIENTENKKVEYITEDIFNNIAAPNLLLADTKTGKIFYERNSNDRIYPASLTKLMTAIVVVENCKLDEIVTVSENAIKSLPSGYVKANLQVGEKLTIRDLLYVMLIPSANDAANALAEYVGGSIEEFSLKMNAKAKELGCEGSNFTNPSGLHQEEHYTTTKDLFLISQAAIKNSIIKKILGTTEYTLPITEKYTKEDRTFTTTNYMKQKNLTKFYYNYCIGAKTGYTEYAKNCVVEFAEKDNIEITAIVMGENSKIKGNKFLDAKEMFEYIFEHYENKKIVRKNEKYETIRISNATRDTNLLDVLYQKDISILKNKNNVIVYKDKNSTLNVEDNNKIIVNRNVEYYKRKAPIKKGEIIGKITYEYEGIKYETNLIARNSVEVQKSLEILKIGLMGLEVLIIILIIIYIIYILKKIKKKNRNKK